MNTGMSRLHRELIRTNSSLAKRLGRTSDPDEATSILREMEEVNFRVMMVGRLLFKETTDAMNTRIQGVIAAATEVDQAIRSIEKITSLIKTIGKFLTAVDKIIDAVKLV